MTFHVFTAKEIAHELKIPVGFVNYLAKYWLLRTKWEGRYILTKYDVKKIKNLLGQDEADTSDKF